MTAIHYVKLKQLLLSLFIAQISFSVFAQIDYHKIDLSWKLGQADCFDNSTCFIAYLAAPNQDIALNRITIKSVFDQTLYSNAEISTLDPNYVASEISESPAPAPSGITFFDFGGAPVFYEADLNNTGMTTTLTDEPQAFFELCLDLQSGVATFDEDFCLTLLWDQISNDLNASGFDGVSEGIEVSVGGVNDEADEQVEHYGWDYGLGSGVFGGTDVSEACLIYCTPCFTDSDYVHLRALYVKTNGSNWTNSNNWLSGCDELCSWYGITCENGKVVSIDLSNNNLVGSIPNNIGQLTSLKELSLRNNQLVGSIPTFFDNLLNLEYLDLRGNLLDGPIPLEFQDKLRTIRLDSNFLIGSIPDYLGTLPHLDALTASYNRLSGCFPSSLYHLCEAPLFAFDFNINLPNFGIMDQYCTNLAGACSNGNCDGNQILINDNPILFTLLQMEDHIAVSGKVKSPNLMVRFEAGNYIEMLASFEVTQNAVYEAIIDDCTN